MAGELGHINLPSDLSLAELLAKNTVPELQQELKRRGLKRSGVKAKLIQRLKEAIEAEEAEEERKKNHSGSNESQVTENTNAGDHGPAKVVDSSFEDSYSEFERSIPGVNDDVAAVSHHEAVIGKDQEDADVQAEAENIEARDFPVSQSAESQETEQEGAEGSSEMPVENKLDLSHEENSNIIEHSKQEEVENYIPENIEESIQAEAAENSPDLAEPDTHIHNEKGVEMEEADDIKEPEVIEETQDEEAEEEGIMLEECIEMVTEGGMEKESKEIGNDEEAEDDIMESKECVDAEQKEEAGKSSEVIEKQKDDAEEEAQDSQEAKQPKKQIVPVHLKKRRLAPPSEDGLSAKQESVVPRKRRWGSSASKESLTISTDSLKSIIPEVSLIPPVIEDPLGLGLDYGEMEEGEIDDPTAPESLQPEDDTNLKEAGETEETEEGNFKKEVRRGRIVRISTKDTVKLQRTEPKVESEKEEDIQPEKDIEVIIPDEKVSLLPGVSSEDPDFVREKSPSPARNDPSRILSIRNLVRPFTLRQLREFLSKSGTVVEDGFWINHIKSHCYVTYATEEEAVESRASIHGCRWPAANPKLLSADFALNDEMYRETGGKLGIAPSPKKIEERKPSRDQAVEEKLSRDRSRDEERISRKNERPREEEGKAAEDSAKPKEKKEAAGKLLDDLFRKTKASPCIYWLPLTKEQIAEKEKEREQRREKRMQLNQEADTRGERERGEREREDRNRQREMGRSEARRDHPSPRRFQNDRLGGGPSAVERRRSPGKDQRVPRQMPGQYRKAKASSPSSSDEDNRGKFSIRR